jgi:uncharacterized surface protein with fasciclin (FAS1) repeats
VHPLVCLLRTFHAPMPGAEVPRRRTMHALLQRIALTASLVVLCGTASVSFAADTVMVGGAAMYPNKTIVENALNSKDHTTLVAAVRAAGLVDTLNGKGPFTVFAPTNEAFAKLPAGTVDTLVKPEHKADLTKILTYHVVAGTHTSQQLMADARKHGGTVSLKTVEGEPLTVKLHGGALWVVDAKGSKAAISIADVRQSNGVIHVVDTVLMPK